MLPGAQRSSEELLGKGLFLQGHFKLSIFQRGGDTGSASRDMWVWANRKWSEVMNQSHMTPLDDFLLLSPPTLISPCCVSTSMFHLPLHLDNLRFLMWPFGFFIH